MHTFIYRWSAVPLSIQLFGDNNQSNVIKTEPVKKCQRALKFFNSSERAPQKNLFNTKPNKRELSKLHKQVYTYLYDCISHFIL